jgi:penicillin-insensitive murein endopeptidase
VRPWSGHDYLFHVRIFCPPDDPQCKPQPPPESGDGCGHELDYWFSNAVLHPAPSLQPASPGRGAAPKLKNSAIGMV